LSWCALVIWAAVIWGLGGEDFGTDSTSRFIRPLLEWLLPGLSAAGLNIAHLSIRKGFHVFEYGLLGLLALRAIQLTWPMPLSRAALIAVGIALALATADETRQAVSETRGGLWTDVLLDVAGASAMVAVVRVLPSRARGRLVGTGGS
jgi:VanZ family protein